MKFLIIFGLVVVLSAVSIHCILTVPTLHNVSPRYRVLDFLHRVLFSMCEYASVIGIGNVFTNYRAVVGFLGAFRIQPKLEKEIGIKETEIEKVRVKIYSPPSSLDKVLPGLIYFHGGGFSIGSPENVETLSLILADRLNALVISVSYKQAPEYVFPGPYEDCFQVTVHIIKNAGSYGIDQKHIALAGDSSGGNLAAAVTQSIVKSNGMVKTAGQVLINPALQFFDFNLPSVLQYKDMYILTQKSMARYWSVHIAGDSSLINTFLQGNHTFHLRNTIYARYLGLPNEDKDKIIAAEKNAKERIPRCVLNAVSDPHASPIMAPIEDIKKLPPTFVVASEYDALRDEGKHYVSRLKEGNVDVKHEYYRGIHNFLFYELIPKPTDEARKAIDDMVEFLEKIYSYKIYEDFYKLS